MLLQREHEREAYIGRVALGATDNGVESAQAVLER